LDVLGLPQEDLPRLLELKDGVLRNAGQTRAERNRLALEGGQCLRDYLGAQLDRRLASGLRRGDLIDGFIHAEFEGRRLEREEIIDTMHLFCLAGLDTVTSAFSCLVGWLARHPDDRQVLVEDPSLVPRAVEELLRYETPVVAGTRYAVADVDVNGFLIRTGERINLIWGTANLDPAHTPDPLKVDFRRASNTHLTFASGFHRCIGSHLARLELRLGLEEFHRRIPEYWIDPDDQPTYVDIGIRSAIRLPLHFGPAADSPT
jgi:cytochrome P450